MKYPAILRVWHWLNALAIFGLLFTVLLRETFLDKKAVAAIVQAKLAAAGITIDPDLAISIGKAVRAPMWEWHYIFAAVLGFAIAIRIAGMVGGKIELPIKKVLAAREAHELLKALAHMGICMIIMVLTLSGVFYLYHDALGFEKDSVHWVKEVHEALLWPLIVLTALHIVGVVRHEIVTKEPIVSRMIHGDAVE